MDETPDQDELAHPVSVRLSRKLLDALDEVASDTGRKRSVLLVEAVQTWLRLNRMGVDARHLYLSKNRTYDEQLAKVVENAQQALNYLEQARAKLVIAHQTPGGAATYTEEVSFPHDITIFSMDFPFPAPQPGVESDQGD